jgi:hypothetical protein
MDHGMGCVLRTQPQMENGKKLGAGVDGEPEPEYLFGTAQPGAQFIQLEVREVEVAEGAFVQGLSMLASSSQPGGDGGLTVAEDSFSSGSIQSFGKR